MKKGQKLFLFIWMIMTSHIVESADNNYKRASVTKFANGMTYCTIEGAHKDCLSIKLAVQFHNRFSDERDQIISAITEKIVVGVLQTLQETETANETIQMHEPELFEIPNLILFRFDLQHPTQRSLNETLAFLNNAFEIICNFDQHELETEISKIIHKYPNVNYSGTSVNKELNLDEYFPQVTGEEIKTFFVEKYRPENIVLVLDGNIKDLSISAAVRTYFPFFIARGVTLRSSQEESGELSSPIFQGQYYIEEHSQDPLLSKRVDLKGLGRFQFCSKTINLCMQDLKATREHLETIEEIVHTLSGSNVAKLLWKKNELEAKGKTIEEVHPLKFIQHILLDPKLNKELRSIQKSFFKWNGFLGGFRRKMSEEASQENLKPYIAAFCQELGVNINQIDEAFENNNWEKFLKILIDLTSNKLEG